MPRRYGIRVAQKRGLLPAVEVTVPTIINLNPYTVHHTSIRRVHGITLAHAWNRALTWTQAHGDPR